MYTGILAKKLGMTSLFLGGERVPVTLFFLDQCRVVGVGKDNLGRPYVQMGVGVARSVSKPLEGVYKKRGLEKFPRKVKNFALASDADSLEIGTLVDPNVFACGQKVDIAGTSKGKGFAGGMKRWNFGGLRASHGVSISHRSIGSTGQCQDPGRVFKGKKMPGRLGCERVTIQNLQVVFVDEEEKVIGVRGSAPGFNGSYVEIKRAVKGKG